MLINTFAGNVGTIPAPMKPAAKPARDVPPTNTAQTARTDNTQHVSEQNETGESQSQNFDSTFNKKNKTDTNNDAQAEEEIKSKNKSDKAISAILSAQPFASDELIATFSVQDKTGKTPSFSQIVKPTITKPGITKPVITKSVITEPAITKPVITKPVITKPVITKPVITESVITKPVITKPVITKPIITKPEQLAPEDTSKTQASDNLPVINSKSIGQEAIAIKSGEKMVIKDAPVITPTPPFNQQSGNESTTKTVISDSKTAASSEQSIVTNEPSASDSLKTQLSNNPAALEDQLSHSRQKVLTSQASPAPAAEETTPNKADTDQKDHRGKTELFELSEKNRVQAGNLPVKSSAQKMNPQRTQLSAPQIENHNNLLSNHGSNPGMEQSEQVLVGGNVQPGITEQAPTLPASVAFAKTAGNADSGASVSDQIQESIHSSLRSGNQQIIIRLNPPELGKVAIKFTEHGDDITGLLQVDRPQTKDQIQQMLPEIIQNLQNSGIAIKKLEVVLTNQQEQYTSKDQSSTAGQDGFPGQQSSPNPQSQQNNTTYNQWLRNIDNVTEFTESQMQLTDNSINVLV